MTTKQPISKKVPKGVWLFEPMSKVFNDEYSLHNNFMKGHTESVMRESVQNWSDAFATEVRIEFSYHELSDLAAFGMDEIAERLESTPFASSVAAVDREGVLSVTFTDNGCGLNGPWDRAPLPGQVPGGFQAFARGAGNSSKGAGKSGSKGAGRHTLIIGSALRTILVHTIRAEDGESLTFGLSGMCNHEYRGESYRFNGLFVEAAQSSGDAAVPFTGDAALEIAAVSRLGRGSGETGTTIMIPACHPDLNAQSVLEDLCRQRFQIIMSGAISFTVVDETGAECVLNKETLVPFLLDRSGFKDAEQLALQAQAFGKAYARRSQADIHLGQLVGRIDASSLAGEDLTLAREALETEGVLVITAPIQVESRANRLQSGIMTYVIVHDDRLDKGMRIRMRDGISVQQTVQRSPYMVLTLTGSAFDVPNKDATPDPVAAMMRDGENTTHDQWTTKLMEAKGWSTSFASDALHNFSKGAGTLLDAIHRVMNEEDHGAFADLFGFPDGERLTAADQNDGEATRAPSGARTERADQAESQPTPFEIAQLPMDAAGNWGVVITARKRKGRPPNIVANFELFHPSGDGRSSKNHSPTDFDLRDGGGFKIVSEDCNSILATGNRIAVANPKGNFRLEISGPFDPNRSLGVRMLPSVKSAAAAA